MLPTSLKTDKKMFEEHIATGDRTAKETLIQDADRIKTMSIPRVKMTLVTIFVVTFGMLCGLWVYTKDQDMQFYWNACQELQRLEESNSILEVELKKIQRKKAELKEVMMKLEQCANVPDNLRFDCHPEDRASKLSCSRRGCCWNPVKKQPFQRVLKVPLNTPYCYYPRDWSLYRYLNYTKKGNDFTGFLENYADSVYKKDVKLIRMEASSVDESILRVKIFDAAKKRYEPHLPTRSDPRPFENDAKNGRFEFQINKTLPGFRVKRSVDLTTIFDSIGTGGFVFADQLLQISTVLPTSNVYGLGEHRTHFKLNTNWQTLTMFNKDQPPTENANLYGSHPFYLVIEESGNCHGVLFLSSNAMDVILQPTPALTFRSIGGVFDMYFFMGPSPADVVMQYSQVVGKPFMPPYWSLGFHLCRYGYGSLKKTKEVWKRTRAAGIPFDTQWNDLDYMDNNNDFTYDKDKFKDLPEFLHEIAEAGMHYIPLIDAGVSASEVNGSYRPFDEGIRRDIFVKEANSNLPFKGKVWNRKSTVWPDFTNPKSHEYWLDMMSDMWHMFPYDGAWIDMNEPSNFYDGHIDGCAQNELDNPPYVPNVVGNLLATKTLCMSAKHYLGSHYDVHNTYGTSEAAATNYALRKIRDKRPFVISRSTWAGLGAYAGHWSGDIYSSWYDMRMTVPQLLSYSLFQIPMMGSDICGFNGNTTQSLCNRWMQLGAFYPFSRNHNTDDAIEQDPVAMGELVVKSSRKALMIRYRFIPYLYTLFFRAHLFGETVARPLFFEFVDDRATHGVDSQFLWGKSLMILPVFEEGATKVTAYLPRGIWYDFYDKKPIASNGKNYTFDAPLDTIPLVIRGGSIIPAQTPGNTTTASRKNKFELLIAPDVRGSATGELFWDDGENLDATNPVNYRWWTFNLDNQTLSHSEVKPGKYAEGTMTLGKVQVMGVTKNVTKVSINGRKTVFEYEIKRSYLTVKNLQIDLRYPFILSWE